MRALTHGVFGVLLLTIGSHVCAQSLFSNRSDWSSTASAPRFLPALIPANPFLNLTRIWVQSAINFANDTDWYRFRNAAQANITIYSTGPTDVVGTLLNSMGSVVWTSNDNDTDHNFRLTFSALAGTDYLLMVRGATDKIMGDYDVLFETAARDDYGNDQTDASIITLPNQNSFQVTYSAVLNWRGDRDSFSFTPLVDGTIVIWVTSNIDTFGWLYGTDEARGISNGLLGTWDDATSTNYNYRMTYALRQGISYWIQSGSWGDSRTGPYDITFNFTRGIDPFLSPTNIGRVFPGIRGTDIIGTLTRNTSLNEGKVHSFRFTNPVVASELIVQTFGNIDLKMSLHFVNRALVVSDDNSAPDGINAWVNISAAATDFIIIIEGSSGTEIGPYSFRITTNAVEDYGNDIATATDVNITNSIDTVIPAVLEHSGDVDVFKFTAPNSTLLRVGTSNAAISIDSYGYLFDANGTRLAIDDDSGPGNNFLIAYNVTTGLTYYIMTHSYNYGSSYSYNLVFDFPDPPGPPVTTTAITRTSTTSTTRTSVSARSTLSVRRTTISTSTSKPVAPTDDNKDPVSESSTSGGFEASVGGLVTIFVGIVFGTFVIAGSVGFFVLRSNSSLESNVTSLEAGTTTISSAYPNMTANESAMSSAAALPSPEANLGTLQMMALQRQIKGAPITATLPPSESHTQTVIDVASVQPASPGATPETLEQFAQLTQLPKLVEFAHKGVTLDQLKVMNANDVAPHGISGAEYSFIRSELKKYKLI